MVELVQELWNTDLNERKMKLTVVSETMKLTLKIEFGRWGSKRFVIVFAYCDLQMALKLSSNRVGRVLLPTDLIQTILSIKSEAKALKW
jgi:hypothetical protein